MAVLSFHFVLSNLRQIIFFACSRFIQLFLVNFRLFSGLQQIMKAVLLTAPETDLRILNIISLLSGGAMEELGVHAPQFFHKINFVVHPNSTRKILKRLEISGKV